MLTHSESVISDFFSKNVDTINSKLFIVRGAPGSGKTTLAKKIAHYLNAEHFENDSFFTDEQGNYKFDFNFHQQAKDECFQKTKKALLAGETVVVSNTFIKISEIEPYIDICIKNGDINYFVIEMMLEFDNTYNVPQSVVEQKKADFEPLKDSIIIDRA